MTNKTPPAWAMQAAIKIDNDCVNGFECEYETEEAARIISQYAPDAEALAVALEEALEEMKSWQIDWERMSDDSGYNPSFSEPTNKASMALSRYRARFPKVTGE